MTYPTPVLTVCLVSALMLSACGDKPSATLDTGEAVIKTEKQVADLKRDIAAPAFSAAKIAKMSPTQMMEAATTESHRLADVLSGVKDEASAEAALAQIKALRPSLSAITERMDNLAKSEIKFSLKTMKKAQAFAEAQLRIMGEMGRISTDHPELLKVIGDGFEDVEITINTDE